MFVQYDIRGAYKVPSVVATTLSHARYAVVCRLNSSIVRFATNHGTLRNRVTNVSTPSFTSADSEYGVGYSVTLPGTSPPVAPTFPGSSANVRASSSFAANLLRSVNVVDPVALSSPMSTLYPKMR